MTACKTFPLGTGARKGGTTWPFRYLRSSPQFVRAYMKEYDVFHALALESEAATPNRIMRQAEGAARIPAVDVEELWPRARWAQ